MSTASVRPSSSNSGKPSNAGGSAGNDPLGRDQGDRLIGDHLEAVRAALWRSVILKHLLLLCGGLLGAVLCFAIIDQWFYSFGMVARSIWIIALIGGTTWWSVTRIVPMIRMRVSPEYAAYSVEMDEPEFQHALTSYVTLRNDRDAPGLRGIVVRSIGARAAKHLKTSGMSMPTETLGNFRPGLFAAITFAALVLYAVFSPKNTAQSISRLAAPLAEIAPPARVAILEVTPGDTDSLFGRSIEVSAKIDGLRESEKPLIMLSGSVEKTIPLSRQEDGKVFAGLIPASFVNDNFQYEIVAGDANSPKFNVVVRDEPTVNISEVQYNPHPYTKLPPRTSSVGAINGLEGTRVTVIASTNRQIVRGRIEFNPREIEGRISATAGFASLDISDDGRIVSASWNLRSRRAGGGQLDIDSYRLRVWDDTETPNSDPIQFPIQVVRDLAPEVRITVPSDWPKDVPLGTEQLVEVRAVDPDFGLAKVELRIRRGTRLLETVELLETEQGERGNQVLSYRFSPDLLGLMVGDLVTIEAVAYDNRTNIEGNRPEPNVVVSDPIELRIVEPPAPSELVDDGDGLTKKTEQSQDEQVQKQGQEQEQTGQDAQEGQQSQTGEQQQGGGGSDEGETSEKREGEGSGGQASDQSQSGEDQADQNQSGTGGSGEGQADSQKGDGTDSASPSESGGDQADLQNSQQNEAGDNEAGDNGGQEQPAGSDASQAESADGPKPNGENEPTGSDQNGGQTGGATGQNGDPNSQSSTGQQADADQQSSSDEQPSSNQQQSSGQSGENDRSPASSDGEAIERIRDYLNQKQESESDAGKADSQPENGTESERAGANGRQGDQANSDSKTEPGARQSGEPSEGEEGDDSDQRSAAGQAGKGDDRENEEKQADKPSAKPVDSEDGANSEPTQSDSKNQSDESSQKTGEQGAGEQGAGEQGAGEQGAGEQGAGEQGAGEQGAGEQGAGEQGAGEQGAGEQGAGEQGAGEQGAGEQGAGEQGAGEQGAGEQGAADGKTSDSAEKNEAATPEQIDGSEAAAKGEPETGKSADDNSGQSSSGGSGDTDSPSKSAPQGDSPDDNDQQQPDAVKPNQDSGTGSSKTGSRSDASPPEDPAETKASDSASGNAVGNNSSGEQMPAGSRPGTSDAPQTPDPVDVEAAKQATDLVLDSLKNQRENPDQELLDRLGWTPDQLRRFVERWEKTRSLGQQNDPAAQRQYEESLKSLGIRPPGTSGPRQSSGRNDQLKDVQDTGQRAAAPPQFRDAIEAYRRSLSSEASED